MKPSTEQDYHERIVRTLVYIQQHLDDDLDLETLARVAAFSSFHFHRIFRGLTGEAVQEYIRRLRLERAARNLKQTGERITQIALEAGFQTHESFTRAFGDMFEVSPSQYRALGCNPPTSVEDAQNGVSRAAFRKVDSASSMAARAGAPLCACDDLPPVEVKELAPMRVVFLRHVGPYSQVGATWGRLMAWAGRRGLLGPGMMLIGIVHDDPDVTPADKVRYDAAVTVSRPVQPEGEFGVMELAGGSYAVIRHKGPYEELGKTYQKIYGGWLPKSGYHLRDVPAFEQYLNSPMNTKPEELVTLIHVPV
jgi:AraC family transcriptional regulator